MTACIDCFRQLTAEESHYYECRCEGCEQFRHERIQRWRAGESDPELEAELCGDNHPG